MMWWPFSIIGISSFMLDTNRLKDPKGPGRQVKGHLINRYRGQLATTTPENMEVSERYREYIR